MRSPGEQEPQDPSGQAGETGRIQIGLEQRPTSEPEVDKATGQPKRRANEQNDVSHPRRSITSAHKHHQPGGERKQQQQVQVPDAPEPVEFEEQREARQECQEQPDPRVQAKVGDERSAHGVLPGLEPWRVNVNRGERRMAGLG
jgi:hypothetical protein